MRFSHANQDASTTTAGAHPRPATLAQVLISCVQQEETQESTAPPATRICLWPLAPKVVLAFNSTRVIMIRSGDSTREMRRQAVDLHCRQSPKVHSKTNALPTSSKTRTPDQGAPLASHAVDKRDARPDRPWRLRGKLYRSSPGRPGPRGACARLGPCPTPQEPH
jgi:hypothetical protein